MSVFRGGVRYLGIGYLEGESASLPKYPNTSFLFDYSQLQRKALTAFHSNQVISKIRFLIQGAEW